MKSRREEMRQRRRRKQLYTRIGLSGLVIALLAAIGYAFLVSTRPAAGQEVPIMADVSHIEEGTDPGPYNSDPPTSGRHYERTLDPGFYEENIYEFPAGHLVHNLEHGYVIFWYDCEELTDGTCEELKADIQDVMDQSGFPKVIAYPWESLDEPVVLTSWGQILRMDEFDPDQALNFVDRNKNQAPEPNAD